jgi:hypothetical protein
MKMYRSGDVVVGVAIPAADLWAVSACRAVAKEGGRAGDRIRWRLAQTPYNFGGQKPPLRRR